MSWLVALLRLFEQRHPESSRFVRFGLVGGSGMVIDISVTWLTFAALQLVWMSDLGTVVANTSGIALAMTWNFFLNRRLTFPEADRRFPWRQYVAFCSSCTFGALVSLAVRETLIRLTTFFADYIIAAIPAGVLAGMIFNYLLCRHFVFRAAPPDEQPPPDAG